MFGEVAERYDANRPSYPAALIDELLAARPATALDVGCGTGIVSALLAARGVRVLGVEPDERMAAVARAKGIDVELSGFEAWASAGRQFELLTAGQSWHWVAPVQGADKAAAVLAPGGRLALFWNLPRLPEHLRDHLQTAYDAFPDLKSDDLATPGAERTQRTEQLLALLGAHPSFGEVQRTAFPWARSHTTSSWVTLLSTHSAYAVLDADMRARVLHAVADAIDAAGGRFELPYDTVLVSARRRPDQLPARPASNT